MKLCSSLARYVKTSKPLNLDIVTYNDQCREFIALNSPNHFLIFRQGHPGAGRRRNSFYLRYDVKFDGTILSPRNLGGKLGSRLVPGPGHLLTKGSMDDCENGQLLFRAWSLQEY